MTDKKSLQALPKSTKPVVKENEVDYLDFIHWPYEPEEVIKTARAELKSSKDGKGVNTKNDSPVARALTLKEFDNGVLISMAVTDIYQSFVIQLSRELQAQYRCNTPAKKSLAEVAALNYCRSVEAQRRINNYLGKGEVTDLGLKFLAIMSKESDRAQRHYLTSLQALELGIQPPMSVNVRTQVANLANQQMVQNQVTKDKAEYGI